MKATRFLLLNLAAAGFLCLPVISAYGAAPQHDDNSTVNHKHEENHGKTTGHERARPQTNNNRARSEHSNTHAQQHGNRNNSHTARNRPTQHMPSYNFRPQDQQRLRQDYNRSNYRHEVNSRNRARLYRGGYLPNGWRNRMHRLPPQYLREFPAPPPGYLIGYFDGYAVVYSPNTGLILQFLNVY